jgi:predicted DsbA family dithiol-disulfide isomerase
MLLKQLFAGSSVDVEKALHHLSRTAEELGLPFGESDRIYNTRLAQELGLWAETKQAGDEFHAAAFKAYFVDGKNLGKMPVLVELAASVGLSTEEASEVLTRRSFQEAVDRDWALSKEKAITAVPTFVMDQDRLVGAQPYETLQGFMVQNGIKSRE